MSDLGACRSCDGTDLRQFLSLGKTPLADNLVHVNHFSPTALRVALERAGFQDVRIWAHFARVKPGSAFACLKQQRPGGEAMEDLDISQTRIGESAQRVLDRNEWPSPATKEYVTKTQIPIQWFARKAMNTARWKIASDAPST